MRVRLAVLYMSIGPYHAARIGALAKMIDGVVGIEIVSRQERYPWSWGKTDSFERDTLLQASLEETSDRIQIEKTRAVLDRRRPNVVMVSGYSDAAMRAAAEWAFHAGSRCIMTTDSSIRDRRRTCLAEFVKAKWCQRYYQALFLAGERSVHYFTELGFPENLCWRGTDVVDNEHFWAGARAARNDAGARSARGLPERYFLCVARFELEKNLMVLLRAFRKYCENGGTWSLVLVGRGREEKVMRQYLSDTCEPDIARRVSIHDWRSYEELPAYYGLANCLVLPSKSEPWGLVVNEAMASGLPVIVSWNCGCVPELCHPGINAYLFDPDDVGDLVRCLMEMSSRSESERMADAGRQIIAQFTPETWAGTLWDCVRSIG